MNLLSASPCQSAVEVTRCLLLWPPTHFREVWIECRLTKSLFPPESQRDVTLPRIRGCITVFVLASDYSDRTRRVAHSASRRTRKKLLTLTRKQKFFAPEIVDFDFHSFRRFPTKTRRVFHQISFHPSGTPNSPPRRAGGRRVWCSCSLLCQIKVS